MNIADIVVIVILCAAVASAAFVMIRDRNKRKNSCGSDCMNCSGCENGTKRKK